MSSLQPFIAFYSSEDLCAVLNCLHYCTTACFSMTTPLCAFEIGYVTILEVWSLSTFFIKSIPFKLLHPNMDLFVKPLSEVKILEQSILQDGLKIFRKKETYSEKYELEMFLKDP